MKCSKIYVKFLGDQRTLTFNNNGAAIYDTAFIQLIMHSCLIYCSFVSTHKLDPSLINIFTVRSISIIIHAVLLLNIY